MIGRGSLGHRQPSLAIVLRGKDQYGCDLIIARECLSHGMRARATELATEWLGRRTGREIQQALQREVGQERWISLDVTIQRNADGGEIDVRRTRRGQEMEHSERC